jgi:hypothetical protein
MYNNKPIDPLSSLHAIGNLMSWYKNGEQTVKLYFAVKIAED